MARTDVHVPSLIQPEDYEFVVIRSHEDNLYGFGAPAAEIFQNHMKATGGRFSTHGGSCHVCGAWMIDYAIFWHAPSNSYIKTGCDCAAHIEVGHVDAFRRQAQLRRAADAKKAGASMIDFMVIGLPRSGTTWAANWLTTESVFCAHDPLYAHHYTDWNEKIALHAYRNGFVKAGVSCTGIWRWPDWVNEQNCPKVILHRNFDEVQDSLTTLDLPRLDDDAPLLLAQCEGLHVEFQDLFDPFLAANIWSYLTDSEFNEFRHSALVDYSIQPRFEMIDPDPAVTRKLYDELSSI